VEIGAGKGYAWCCAASPTRLGARRAAPRPSPIAQARMHCVLLAVTGTTVSRSP
jgi:hypothetical protein